MRKITKILALAVLLIGLSQISQALGHGAGASFEQTVDNYLIDIGYSSEEPVAGDPIRFDLFLADNITNEEVEFTNVWVRIEQGNKSFFAGSIGKARFGLTGFLYSFEKPGDYKVFARFENDEGSIAETSFPLSIKGGNNKESGTSPFIIFLAGIFLGALASLITVNLRKK